MIDKIRYGVSKEKLNQYIDYLELALVGAGIAVFIGLIVEDGPELWHSLITRTWPSRAALGDLLVTVGVFCEVLIAFVIARIARRIDAYGEADTATALERAAHADERAAEANRLTEQERLARVKLEAELRNQVEDERIARFEMEESLLRQREAINRKFQRTGNRTLDPVAFHAALKGKPTAQVLVLARMDDGESHNFGWQIWYALNRLGTGWSAEIKELQPKEGWTGMIVRCRNPREDSNWHGNPTTACGALLNALSRGTEGFANVANGGTTFVIESDPSLPDNKFVIEVRPQPEPLTDQEH
jgi:hypothetical protein